ncbi:NAD(P)-dependent alcohol dehydrogenase [Frankia sp. Cr1]|uniref:NAD(P)-dependent alcohol dehydrogenase n=1 Tax=Frankia sp. Cr1 TaxID=3073931 RepID=UPI002AD21DC8|nr:NAD(P)-dependent alcohol dehydrogenase [Frankia sp. Cr1]
MTTTEAAIVEKAGEPFTLSEVELDDPRPDEVVVRLVAAGVCHTDLTVAGGGLPFPLPGVLGHEGAGVVESVGSGVSRVQPGDHVLLSFTSCGRCGNCRDGHPAYCATWLPMNLLGGVRADGSSTITRAQDAIGGHFFGQSSFSRHALVDERSVVKVDADVALNLIAPLGCGVQTGAGAVWNILNPRPGATIAVTGAGSVGLSAIMAAALTPATRIIAVDRIEQRLRLAVQLGATDVVNATDGGVAEQLAEITGGAGVDGVVETTGNTAVLRTAIDCLAARGTAVIVGAPPFGSEVALDVNAMLGGRQVVGITLGDSETERLLPVLVALVRSGRMPVQKLITEYGFSQIQTAVDDMVAGKTIKPVLTF